MTGGPGMPASPLKTPATTPNSSVDGPDSSQAGDRPRPITTVAPNTISAIASRTAFGGRCVSARTPRGVAIAAASASTRTVRPSQVATAPAIPSALTRTCSTRTIGTAVAGGQTRLKSGTAAMAKP